MFTILDTNLWYGTALPYAPTDATLRIPLSYSIPGYVIPNQLTTCFHEFSREFFPHFLRGFYTVLISIKNYLSVKAIRRFEIQDS